VGEPIGAVSELAREAAVDRSYVTPILRLGFLAPAIVMAILRGCAYRAGRHLPAPGLAGPNFFYGRKNVMISCEVWLIGCVENA
jgi:hypothetical protein